jgi:hypothetical protein
MAFGSDDTNGAGDTFVYDTKNKVITRGCVASDGSQGNRFNAYTSITDDGRYVR